MICNWKRMLCLACMALVLLIAPAALAELEPLLPKEQMLWYADEIPGLAITPKLEDGNYHFVIDSEATDWGVVTAYFGGSQWLELTMALEAPEGAVYRALAGYDKPLSQLTEAEIEQGLEAELSTYDNREPVAIWVDSFYNLNYFVQFADYLHTQQTVYPQENAFALVVRWYDANKQPMGTQKLDVTCSMKGTAAQHVDPVTVSASRITPDNGDDLLSYEYAKGTAVYQLPVGHIRTVQTKVAAPAGAASCLVNGLDKWGGPPDSSSFENGVVTLNIGPGHRLLSLSWYDAGGKLLLCEILGVKNLEKDAGVWMSYIDRWESANVIAVSTQHTAGILSQEALAEDALDGHIVYDFLSTDMGSNHPQESIVTYTIQAPEAAKNAAYICPIQVGYINLHNSGHGANDREYEWYPELWEPTDGTYTIKDGLFNSLLKTDEITVYQSIYDNEEDDYGMTWRLCWLDEDGKLLATSWLAIQAEKFLTSVKTPPVASEDELKQPVKQPVFIYPQGSHYVLVSEKYPQVGKDVYHLELHLEDGEGWISQPGEDTVFYLPYPNGHSYESNTVFKLKHYSPDYSSFEWVELEATPYGLRFVTDHLSPFVLAWEDNAPVGGAVAGSTVPKTGDNTPIAALCFAMIVSAAVACTVIRKRRA